MSFAFFTTTKEFSLCAKRVSRARCVHLCVHLWVYAVEWIFLSSITKEPSTMSATRWLSALLLVTLILSSAPARVGSTCCGTCTARARCRRQHFLSACRDTAQGVDPSLDRRAASRRLFQRRARPLLQHDSGAAGRLAAAGRHRRFHRRACCLCLCRARRHAVPYLPISLRLANSSRRVICRLPPSTA